MSASHQIEVEICSASLSDVLQAEAVGAHRVELNAALPLGGLTPSAGLVNSVVASSQIPVIAMARPRESGFSYSRSEFATLLADIEWLLEAGVDGVAFGVLTPQGHVAMDRCRDIVRRIGDRDAVFHRAFDLVPDPIESLEHLIECGVNRVMTSGGYPTAWEGRAVIAELVKNAGDRIEILAAGGIRSDHASHLVEETGLRQIHAGPGQIQYDPSFGEHCRVGFYGKLPEDPGEFRTGCESSMRQLCESLRPPA